MLGLNQGRFTDTRSSSPETLTFALLIARRKSVSALFTLTPSPKLSPRGYPALSLVATFTEFNSCELFTWEELESYSNCSQLSSKFSSLSFNNLFRFWKSRESAIGPKYGFVCLNSLSSSDNSCCSDDIRAFKKELNLSSFNLVNM